MHSRRVVVASQPAIAAGSRILPQMARQLEPHGLADVLGIGAAQLVPAADRPDQRGVPLDEGAPRLLVGVGGAGHQGSDGQVIAHRGQVLSGACFGGTAEAFAA